MTRCEAIEYALANRITLVVGRGLGIRNRWNVSGPLPFGRGDPRWFDHVRRHVTLDPAVVATLRAHGLLGRDLITAGARCGVTLRTATLARRARTTGARPRTPLPPSPPRPR